MKFIAGLATGSLIACAMALAVTPAKAEKKEHKKATDDYAVSHPAPVPVQPRVANGSIFQVNDGYAALYEGQRARRVGDTLSIVLVEKTTASKSSGTKLDSGGGFSLTPPSAGPLSFNPGAAKVSGARNFGGTGTADQSNALSGEVSVTVAEVYPNGTMLVQGQKRVTLNRGDEFVQIKGIVRVADIDENNRIPSTRVADARISYTGKGDVARAARQGWLSRFFQILSPF
jgi:flagellar L-ring protein precursor FlgH